MRPLKDGKLECKKVPDFNYTMEMSTYGEPNFGLVGRHTLHEFGGVLADVYMGRAVDGNGPLSCTFYCDSETCKGLYIFNKTSLYLLFLDLSS